MVEAKPDQVWLGVHLGNTNISAAVIVNGKIEMVLDPQTGNSLMPSVVSIEEQKMHKFGVEAVQRLHSHQSKRNVIFGCKQILGTSYQRCLKKDEKDKFKRQNRDTEFKSSNEAVKLFKADKFAPEIVKESIKKRSTHNKFALQVQLRGEETFFMAQDVAKVLIKAKMQQAALVLGKEITQAILTVPDYFDNAQRDALKDACELAGLTNFKLCREPIAALSAFGLQKGLPCLRFNHVVIRCGGTNFEASIVKVGKHDKPKVKKSVKSTSLGGYDFDTLLVNQCERLVQSDTPFEVRNG